MQNFSHFSISEISMYLTNDIYVKFNEFFSRKTGIKLIPSENQGIKDI